MSDFLALRECLTSRYLSISESRSLLLNSYAFPCDEKIMIDTSAAQRTDSSQAFFINPAFRCGLVSVRDALRESASCGSHLEKRDIPITLILPVSGARRVTRRNDPRLTA